MFFGKAILCSGVSNDGAPRERKLSTVNRSNRSIFLFTIAFCLYFAVPKMSVDQAVAGGELGRGDQSPGVSCIVLLHGMGRTKFSMRKAAAYLAEQGFQTVNVNYPSTKMQIAELVKQHIPPAIRECKKASASPIHFLTHSLGGILVRQYLQDRTLPKGSRVVMLSPPNKGSELVDVLKDFFIYKLSTGPAGQQLGTAENSVPNSLKPIVGEIGVITGDASIEPWFSMLIAGEDDGKVSVESAKLKEAADFLVVSSTHPFIMNSDEVLEQAAYFFKNGRFKKPAK